MKLSNRAISRRQYIERSAQGISYLTLGSAAMVASAQLARAVTEASRSNPFAYDISRFAKTDPKLIRYEEVGRVASPHPEARRLAIGPKDRLYIANRNGIDALNREGVQQESIKLESPARCVAVAADGVLYAGLKDHVEVYDPERRRVANWEAPGKRPWLSGLFAGENDLLAADSGNRVVLRYDRSGKLVGRIGEKNKERQIPGLIVPSPYLDVALGRDGLLR